MPAPRKRLGEEAAEPGEPHDLRVPPAQHVVGAVVGRIQGQGAEGLLADDLRPADPLPLAHRERGPADRRGHREVALGARRIRGDRPPGQRFRPREERIALGRRRGCRGSARPRPAGRRPRASWPRSRWSRARGRPRSGRARYAGRGPRSPPRPSRRGPPPSARRRAGRRRRRGAPRRRRIERASGRPFPEMTPNADSVVDPAQA